MDNIVQTITKFKDSAIMDYEDYNKEYYSEK